MAKQQDAIEIIEQDHQVLLKTYDEYLSSSGKRKEELSEQILKDLTIHAAVEEKYVYPALANSKDIEANAMAIESETEHQQAKLVVAELEAMGIEDARFEPKMKALMESVQNHMQEEESLTLPKLREIVSVADLEEMGTNILEKKKELAESTTKRMISALKPQGI